jgi:hypothetical protein
MPRVRINLHDIEEIEDLEDQEDWEELIGLYDSDQQRAAPRVNPQERGRGNGAPRENRFGGTEVRDRKRSERRKEIARSNRRYSQQRP